MKRTVVSLLLIFCHYLFLRIKASKNNSLLFGKGLIIWKSKIKVLGKHNKLVFGKSVNLKNTIISIKGNNNRISISDEVKIYEYCMLLIEGDNCEIKIGAKSTVGSGHIFCGESNTKIHIGENCMLSRKVFMNTSDFHSILDATNHKRINPPQDIFIDDHVWIGFNTTINKGAILKKNSIVASRSLVGGKSYPPNVILAGIPSKVIKENITWSREKLPFN